MTPHIKLVGDKLPIKGRGGQLFFFVMLKPEADEAIYQHELAHVRQWWLATIINGLLLAFVVAKDPQLWPLMGLAIAAHGIMYRFKSYRLWAEVRAHRVQLRHGHDIDRVARSLSNESYGFGITHQQAVELLR